MSIRTVGILLNTATYQGISSGKTGQESITNYEDSAALLGLVPVYIRIRDIQLHTGECTAYMRQQDRFIKVRLPLPRVIHNRAIYQNAASHQLIEELQRKGIIIFNVYNRYGKDQIHQLLSQNELLRGSLPETKTATKKTVATMMSHYDDLILKPCSGSVGKGILRLQRIDSGWQLSESRMGRKRAPQRSYYRDTQLPAELLRRLRGTPYLIQQRIPLAEYQQRPFDLRVTIQRGALGAWGITGMLAKVAAPHAFVSNIAQGGQVYPVPHVLAVSMPYLDPTILIHRIEQFAFMVARHLEGCLPHVADLGLDLGLTADGQVIFIECNGRDQRYGFKKAGMPDVWKNTYQQPMHYASYLLNGLASSNELLPINDSVHPPYRRLDI